MAGETIIEKGSYTQIITAAATADNDYSAESTAISVALTTGQESNYPLLDFKLEHTTTNAASGSTVGLYRRSTDGTDKAPVPNETDYDHDYVGTFTLDAGATGDYYLYGVPNVEPAATYYIKNNDGTSSLTLGLLVRARTYKGAA